MAVHWSVPLDVGEWKGLEQVSSRRGRDVMRLPQAGTVAHGKDFGKASTPVRRPGGSSCRGPGKTE